MNPSRIPTKIHFYTQQLRTEEKSLCPVYQTSDVSLTSGVLSRITNAKEDGMLCKSAPVGNQLLAGAHFLMRADFPIAFAMRIRQY